MTVSFGILSDNATRALAFAVDGLEARGQAMASNIANVETPNYLAHQVDFEASLRAAYADGDPSKAAMSTTESLAATRTNGNNVNIDFELLAQSENVLREKLVVQALNNKYTLLRTAITG